MKVFYCDHYEVPLPELGGGGRRLAAEDMLCFQRLNRRLSARFGEAHWLVAGPFVNSAALAEHGVERDRVEEEAARLLSDCPGVARVWRRTELGDDAEPAAQLFVNAYHAGRSPDLMVQFEAHAKAVGTEIMRGS